MEFHNHIDELTFDHRYTALLDHDEQPRYDEHHEHVFYNHEQSIIVEHQHAGGSEYHNHAGSPHGAIYAPTNAPLHWVG